MYPSRVLIVSPLVPQSWPSTLAWPLVGGSRPSRILIMVDLPAPFAPTSPVTPGATVTVSPSSAVTFPGYTMVSILVSMTASLEAPLADSPADSLAAGGGSDGSEAWVDGMVLPCQRASARVISPESEPDGSVRTARSGGRGAARRRGLHLQDDAPGG